MFLCYLQFCVFFRYFKFSLTNFFFYQEALENLRKFHRWKHNKSCLKDPYFLCRRTLRNGIELRHNLYLSIRKLSIPSPFSNLSQVLSVWLTYFFQAYKAYEYYGCSFWKLQIPSHKNFIELNCDRIEPPCLSCVLTLLKLVFAPRFRAVKKPCRAPFNVSCKTCLT